MRVLFVILAVLLIVPGWTGEERLALLGSKPQMVATRVDLDPADPRHVRLGRLTYLGGVALRSIDPAFGGYSALHVAQRADGNRFTMLSDGGNVVAFTMGADWQPRALAFLNLPAGPGIGWDKRDRDSESLAVDPTSGRVWVGYEGYNAIWRYAPGFVRAEAQRQPRAMAGWPDNGGPESLALLPDGRFLTIGEERHVPRQRWRGSEADRLASRDALLFPGDPITTAPVHWAYLPYGRYDPADATALPNGDVLVLDRAFRVPYRFSNRLSLIPAAAIRQGAAVRGRLLATLDAPLIHDNFEGLATTIENGATIVWLVSDDNQSLLQRTLLLKFRLD
ncbi:esterase-like activity of phytase family protein [Sphingomonas sp. RP10(2022)]|uniref:Esterase-like activity of phytase family protein n=1 Tax=Sphingomonas liriopis TaxID=2949094 RepID=A0A9X2I2B8_9SPHN|nr:esterase-like activity of phytase family protein [Sphingomonas liriopis]MCP3736560.1 esterase-like activity of phytase family protein [Sphingomonas liriopis]